MNPSHVPKFVIYKNSAGEYLRYNGSKREVNIAYLERWKVQWGQVSYLPLDSLETLSSNQLNCLKIIEREALLELT